MKQIRKYNCSTKRINSFRDELLSITPQICTERAILATNAYKDHEMDQTVLKRAYMLQNILENMTIYIEPQTLIVGNQASSNRAAPIFPEYAMDWIIRELDEFNLRTSDTVRISDENKQLLRNIYPYWKGRTLQDKAYAAYPEQARLVYDLGIIRNEGNITSGDGHLAVDYEGVLRYGLKMYIEKSKKHLGELDLTNFEELKKSFFYRALIIVLESVINFAGRYADLAEKMARNSDSKRAVELIKIAEICRNVPEKGANTFHEALQSVWFLHLALQIESNGHSMSFGRLDQFLMPCFENSISNGMTNEEAIELLENLWLKTLSVNKVRSKGHSRFAAGSPMYQNVTIGGQTSDGKSAINKLSELVLHSVANVHLPQPNLTVRYFKDMPESFMEKCIEVIKEGFGMPAFNNDEINIPSLMHQGVAKDDAYNYCAVGCIEIGVPGKWGYRCTGMSYLNFPKTLLIAMNKGIDPDTGKKICDMEKHFTDMKSFDEVLDAWDKAARMLIRTGMILDQCADMVIEQEVPDILCSALVDDCIARGKHLKEGGAIYDMVSQLQVGIANLGDSLAAIKSLVFDKKIVTTAELWDALASDFESEKGEQIRKLLLSSPKFGNDDDYVDSLVVKGYDTYLDEIKKYRNTRHGRGVIGGHYYPGTSSVAANVAQGASTTATPDGRKSGEPLAEGCSPARSADTNGPTSVFKSVSKLRTIEITGGVLLNQKVSPEILVNKEDSSKLIALIRTFFDILHGFHVQYNVISREILLDAQKNPENHKDLIVRVAGYSTFFNLLSLASQNDIIARTEQTL
jgi:pyruvate formate-lyase/glycerol dehydratase family glycyl radical enzyme